MSLEETMTVKVMPYSAKRDMTYYVTWADTPKGWGIMVVNEMFYFPVRVTISWPNGEVSIPDNPDGERVVDVDFLYTRSRKMVCYPTPAEAKAYIIRQACKETRAA